MSFHLDICVTTNLLQQRPTASINIHTWITYSYSCLSFWVHAWYQFVISLHQIWYSNQNLALNNMSFHFGDICVTAQLLQHIFNNIHMRITLHTWAFIFMSVFLSSCFIPICRIILPCLILKAFIYTIVCSYTCRLYWDHALQLPYWKFAALLCLTLLWRLFACRRRPSCTISCIFESLYIREHSYTCLSFWLHALYRFVLPSPCFSFIHCITLPHSMFDASHFEIPLLRWFACWKQQTQKIITAAYTY